MLFGKVYGPGEGTSQRIHRLVLSPPICKLSHSISKRFISLDLDDSRVPQSFRSF